MAGLGWLAATVAACAHAGQIAWDAALYAAATTMQRQANSVLNPGNALARLPDAAASIEARIDLKLKSESLQLMLRPILRSQRNHGGLAEHSVQESYLSQWQLRAPLAESLALSFGREVMNWGPAQFRSPSSPFYFDNGRRNPTRELSGIDALKLAWTPDASRALSLAWIEDNGAIEAPATAAAWNGTWLAKGELRGDDWTGSLVLARPSERTPFFGGYAQWTPDAAWLLYVEAASSTRTNALQSPADLTQPFSLKSKSARHGIALLGAMHTLENGQSLNLEYLHDGHGYRQAEAAAYFARSGRSAGLAAQALSQAPPLLGRRYLHLVWQNNMLQEGDYWRLMWSRNLDDGSDEFAAYFDHPLNHRLNLYALGAINSGGARREFAALIEHSLTVGLRLALP